MNVERFLLRRSRERLQSQQKEVGASVERDDLLETVHAEVERHATDNAATRSFAAEDATGAAERADFTDAHSACMFALERLGEANAVFGSQSPSSEPWTCPRVANLSEESKFNLWTAHGAWDMSRERNVIESFENLSLTFKASRVNFTGNKNAFDSMHRLQAVSKDILIPLNHNNIFSVERLVGRAHWLSAIYWVMRDQVANIESAAPTTYRWNPEDVAEDQVPLDCQMLPTDFDGSDHKLLEDYMLKIRRYNRGMDVLEKQIAMLHSSFAAESPEDRERRILSVARSMTQETIDQNEVRLWLNNAGLKK